MNPGLPILKQELGPIAIHNGVPVSSFCSFIIIFLSLPLEEKQDIFFWRFIRTWSEDMSGYRS
jgi:hypothetical protein